MSNDYRLSGIQLQQPSSTLSIFTTANNLIFITMSHIISMIGTGDPRRGYRYITAPVIVHVRHRLGETEKLLFRPET